MAERTDRPVTQGAARSAVVWHGLRAALEDCTSAADEALDILDAGGGTGGFAVPLAALGHRVTVVDASPDSLAALQRRCAEAKVADRVVSLQGDVANLPEIVAPAVFDAAICHSVLEMVDEPGVVLAGIAACLRPGGLISVVVANAAATVLHRAVAGRLDEALHALRDPLGRYGPNDPLPRRFGRGEIEALLAAAGFDVTLVQGSRVLADIVPAGVVDPDSKAAQALQAIELEAAGLPALRDIAAQFHLLGRLR
jgi:SAM-dependent methyltransferase